MQIQDKVFVVTGGGNGIGREVVLGLLRRGARVAAVDVSDDGLAGTSKIAGSMADRMTSHRVDITDRAAVDALPEQVVAAHGHVDGLLNVAGIIQRFVPFADLSHDDMAKVIDVNFWGVVHMCKAFLPHLMERPAAGIVNVSSMGGFVPVPGQTMYGASKAAVKLFTEGLYAETRDSTVDVTVVFPGGVATDIAQHSGATVPGQQDAADAPTSLTTPSDAARQIIDGLEKGSYRVVIGRDAAMLDRLVRLAPQRATDIVAKRMASLLGD